VRWGEEADEDAGRACHSSHEYRLWAETVEVGSYAGPDLGCAALGYLIIAPRLMVGGMVLSEKLMVLRAKGGAAFCARLLPIYCSEVSIVVPRHGTWLESMRVSLSTSLDIPHLLQAYCLVNRLQ
jgi:hypothetical protein